MVRVAGIQATAATESSASRSSGAFTIVREPSSERGISPQRPRASAARDARLRGAFGLGFGLWLRLWFG